MRTAAIGLVGLWLISQSSVGCELTFVEPSIDFRGVTNQAQLDAYVYEKTNDFIQPPEFLRFIDCTKREITDADSDNWDVIEREHKLVYGRYKADKIRFKNQ